MPPLPETPAGWIGSLERSEALKLAGARGAAARATGLLEGDFDAGLRSSFERTTQQVARFLNAPVGLFSLLEGDCQVVLARTSPLAIPDILPADSSMCVHVRDSGRDIIVDDLSRSEFGDVAGNMTAAGANAYMGTPVFSPDGHPIGSLCAIDLPSRSWEPADLDLLRSLAEGLTDKIALLESLARAQASEARLITTIETIPNPVYVFEPDGRIGYASPQVQTLFGLDPEELMGFGYLRHLEPSDAERMMRGMRERAADPSPFEQEFRLRDAKGEWRELLASGRPFRDPDGQVGYIASTTEIGHLRQAERELASERRKLAAVVETIPHLVWTSAADGRTLTMGPQIRNILGHEPEAHLGYGWKELFHPEDAERILGASEGILGEPQAFELEYRMRHADGTYRDVIARGTPVQDEHGETVYISTGTDIGDIRATERALAQERARLEALMEALPHIVVLSNLENGVEYVSPQVRTILGHEPESVLGSRFYPTFIYPDDIEGLRSRRGELLGKAEPFEMELRARDADGNAVPMLMRGFPLPPGPDVRHTHVVTFTEIAAIRAAEARAEEERRRLRTVLDVLPTGVVIVDGAGRVTEANAAARAIVGATPEDLASWPQASWIDAEGMPTPIATEEAHISRALRGDSVRDPRTMRIAHPSGDRFVFCDAEPLRDESGSVTGAVMTISDVTDLRRAQDEVQNERRAGADRVEAMLDAMPIFASLLDPDGRILYVNEGALGAAGIDRAGVVGTVAWESRFLQGSPEAARILREAIETGARGESAIAEMSFQWEDHTAETRQFVVPIRDVDGRVTALSVSGIDLTEINRAAREIEEERTRLSTVIDILPSGLLICNPQGRVQAHNPEAERLFGIQEDGSDALFPPGFFIEADGSETPFTRETAPIERALRGETIREPRTIRFLTPDGSSRYVKCDAVPIFGSDGSVDGAVMTALDISELRFAQEAAERERIQVMRRMERVIDSLPINVVLADPEGRLLYANETALAGVSQGLDEIVGQIAWESPWMPNAETAAIVREEYERAAGGETTRREFSIRYGPNAEEVIEIDHSVVPIRGEDGRVEFLLPSSIDVTARNRALREVEAERRRLGETVEGMPVGLFVFDRDMNLIQANDEAFKATGLTPDLMAANALPELSYIEPDGTETRIDPQDAPSWRALKGEGGRETRPMRFHYPGTDPADDIFVHIEAAPLTNATGEIEGAIVTAVDVKPLLEAEKALAREREEAAARVEEERRRLRQIVDNLPIGLFVFDRDRKILQANEEGLASFGLSREQMDAKDYPDVFYLEPDGTESPADPDVSPLRRVLRGESGREPRVVRMRYPGARPEQDRFVRAEAAALTDDDGQIEGAVFTVVDVKPLREAERALSREREAATERLTATLEGVSIFIGLLDLQGRIVWCNQGPLLATGLTFADVENVVVEHSAWFNHNPEMIRRVAEVRRKAAQGEIAFTPTVARRVGGFMDVDLSLAPIRGEDGAVRYLVASGIEVTQRNLAMRQIEDARMSAERAREIAERATRAKDDFLAVLSHELRTPLTPAMLGLELLGGDLEEILPSAGDPALAASIVETMATVRSNLEIQVRLIDDLLDVTRIARGKLELRKKPVDLHDAARHALSIVQGRAEEKGVALELSPDAERSVVSADPARLRQILWNLLANAVKFTDAGGSIRVETEAAGPGTVRLKVVDTGLGIDAERLATIFDAFDQGDGAVSRGFGGLGLGLAIARSLARAHGGTLWATSAGQGQGATFVLELPTSVPISESEGPANGRTTRQMFPGCRVLLVEDNLDTARLTAMLLSRTGVEVEVAHSVAEAVAVGGGGRWDAILTDIGLPDGDGLEAVSRLRGIGVSAPAIAMSGYGRDEDKARTADAGFRAHLVKPLVFENLLEVLDAVLPENG